MYFSSHKNLEIDTCLQQQSYLTRDLEVKASRISTQSAHEGGWSLALSTGRLFLQEILLTRPQAIVLPGINSLKNPNDPIGNRTRDLLACNAVPQPIAPPHETPSLSFRNFVNERNLSFHGAQKCFSSHTHILQPYVAL